MYSKAHARENEMVDARANALAQAAGYHSRQGDARYRAVIASIRETLVAEFPAIAPERLARRAVAAIRRRSNWAQ